jgi:hypothetical protein
MKKKWLKKCTTNQLIRHREMTMIDLAAAEERGRDRLVKMLELHLCEIISILKERQPSIPW